MVKQMLTTEIITPSITKLINDIEENLSTFDSIEKVLEPIEEETFFENNLEQEENVSENPAVKVKNKGKNPWIEFWIPPTPTQKMRVGTISISCLFFCILEQIASTSDALLVKYFT